MDAPKRRGGEKPRIFLGSSGERRKEAEEIASILVSEGWEVVAWWNPTVFPPGKTTFSSLMRLGPSLDAALLIFSDDDKVWFRGTEVAAPRDNVLIEYGLFMGIVGGTEDDRVVICRIGDPKSASDLAGITFIQFDPANPLPFIQVVRPWLSSILGRSAVESHGLARVYTTRLRRELFLSGERIVRATTRRLVLCARTPVPIVGTRPYDGAHDSSEHEKTQFEAYETAIESLATQKDKQIMLVGCLDSLKGDLGKEGIEFQSRVLDRLNSLYTRAASLGGRLSIRWSSESSMTTFVTGDAEAIVWFKNGDGENIWFHCSNKELATALQIYAQRTSKPMSLSEVLSALGLKAA